MRKAFAIIILLCVAYFIGGWMAVKFGVFESSSYFSYAGIVGGLASVVGLLSFTRSPISKTDLEEIEIESLRSLVETSDQLKKLESERARTKAEIGNLELQKKEMELLVKKASIALFLKEQYSHHEKIINDAIKTNAILQDSLIEIQDISKKIKILNEEIESDPNVAQLKEIMQAASRRQPTLEEAIEDMPALAQLAFYVTRELGKAMSNLIGTIK
jgi:predicted  nucleic acid-binding Zn-ribbon protein